MRPEPIIVWIIGVPSAGKSTLAQAIRKRMAEVNWPSLLLDGDDLRRGLCSGLGFSDVDRTENLRRAAEVAAISARSGVSSVVAMITPMEAQRIMIRSVLADFQVKWVWADCPLEECRKRDVKGLYQDHTSGQISNMTGIDGPFEMPSADLLRLNTADLPILAAVDQIWSALGHLKAEGEYPSKGHHSVSPTSTENRQAIHTLEKSDG